MQPSPKVEDILKLTITDGTNPISGANVTIGSDSETSDESGEVEFTLEYGDYSASVSADGYDTKTESIAFRSNHKNFTIELESISQTGTVTITVLDNSDDSPIMGASVELSDDTTGTNVIASGFTDENGETVLVTDPHDLSSTDIPFGNYYLYTAPSGYTEYNEAFTVNGDEDTTIKLTPINDGEGG